MKKIVILTIASLAFIGCKKESAETKSADDTTAPTIETPAVETPEETSDDVAKPANGEVVKLEIHGTDDMKYDKTELTVPAGSKVELTLVHTGKMPESSMGHNWVLLTQGTDVQEFAMNAINAKDTDYVPADAKNVIAHTEVIGGGESTTITFDAPEAGTYNFLCSFPGHFGNMQGKFIVK